MKSILRNYISFAGLLIVCVSVIFIGFILLAEWMGFELNPYIGVVAFLVLPAFMIFGFVLMPLGRVWERRRLARRAGASPGHVKIEFDLDQPRTRRRILFGVTLSAIIVAFMAATAYESVVFMDTTTFCGEVCHSVMQPELTSYRNSPHARVPCVECHIGEGANWYVKSKLSGLGQVYAVTFDTYETPIPTPVANLRPARETCEHCHWPRKFLGSRLVVNTRYQEDEANTPLKNVLLMKIGGGSEATGGIHWHMNIKNKVEYYASDYRRDTILYIRSTDPGGKTTEYVAEGSPLTLDELRAQPLRVMDCMDCHNRPSHTFDVPQVAVDVAMATGDIPPDLPFIKREAMKAIVAEYSSREVAPEQIRYALQAFYRSEYPDIYSMRSGDIDKASMALAEIYLRNIFPDMKITWGTYPNQIGHTFANGCFRCHDEAHTSPGGETISQDCSACHELLSYEEENPQPVLENLPLR